MAYVSLCRALYDYEAAAEDELSFTEDALLYVVDAEDAEWWKAKLRTGDDDDVDGPVGLIPANYVEEAEPIRASRALYDYARQNDDELDITEDEMLSVYEIKGDWLLVKRQENGVPIGSLGFVPANYVDEVAAVDGVTEPMEAASTTNDEPEYIAAGPTAVAPAPPNLSLQAAANKRASVSAARAVAKDDDIKMWAVSLLDAKKKKKKGTLGIGNSALFFASESDKAPVQKLSVLSILDHTVEGKGKQLDLELDDEAASKVETDEKQQLRFVMSSKGDVEEVWAKIEESQRKALQAQEEADEEQEHQQSNGVPAPPPLPQAARPTGSAIPIPPPPPPVATPATLLPPPSRATAVSKSAAPAVSAPTPTSELANGEERAIALYDFEAQGDDELAVSENEALILVDRETEDWWKVRNADGQEGVVPASYVELVSDEPQVAAVTSKASTMKIANERDRNEAQAARDAAARAAAEEERQREEEEAEAERLRQEEEEEEAAERARMQEERRANAEAQRRAREAEERRRQALKAKQPTPAAPRAAPITSSTSASAASRDISIPSGRSAPARPKEAGSKSKPSPARTRTWHDRSGQFKVEAEFLGFNQGKIRLHKLNGVVIEVAIEKMSQPDIQYLEEVTGRKLAPPRSSRSAVAASNGAEAGGRDRERERERRREQEREQRRRQESARGPKRNVDWFEFFLASGVDIDDCTRYASAFERDKIDESILPELDVETLRKLGLREGDVIRVNKFIQKKYNKGGSGTATPGGGAKLSASDQIKADEALARKLQEQEQAARRNGTTPPPNLFSGQDGALKNNTRRGRPTNNNQRNISGGVDAASLAAVTDSLARTSTPPTRSNTTSPEMIKAQTTSTTTTSGFDDDAWTPRPPSAKPATPAAAVAPLPSPAAPVPPTPPPQPPRPTSSASTPAAAASVPSIGTPESKPDPNSALFDKLAAMKPSSPSSSMRPGASPLGGAGMYSGPRGPFAPVAQNQSMLQPLVPTHGTGQFVPTSMGYQQTGMGMMQPQQTGWAMQAAQPTGYMASPIQAHQTGASYGGGMQSPFGMQQPQQTGYSPFAQQPQTPQQTSQQYAVQQNQQKQQEINSGPERFSAANVFGQMKQGNLHQQPDPNAAPQAPQRYDALRAQPTGFQPGGYLNSQYTGFGGGGYGYQ